MAVERISAREAQARLDQGHAYLDVRAVAEFDAGHPRGAYNIPLLVPRAGGGSEENRDFLRVVRAVFARQASIVVGCASGVRSLRAAELLIADGYAQVSEQRAGMEGVRDAFGRVREKGHRAEGLPTSVSSEAGRSYAALLARADQALGAEPDGDATSA
jgi:rhodanese-related sulfurtransferase